MNPNYIHTITVYNRIRPHDSPTKRDIWYRTVLQSCFWQCKTKEQQMAGSTRMTPENTFVVRIPQKQDCPQNPDYLPYRKWIQSPDGYFTLAKGDIIVHGECDEMISPDFPAAELLKKYAEDAFIITSTADNTKCLFEKHYRAGG